MKKKFFKGLLLAAMTLVQGMTIPAASMVKMAPAPAKGGHVIGGAITCGPVVTIAGRWR